VDWIDLLQAYGIEFVTKGPNTRRGELSCKCPWCGEDDPSQHLGISLTKDAWGCHRNLEHRGKSPLKLISALLGCSYSQARLVAAQYGAANPGAFDTLAPLNTTSDSPKPVMALSMPAEFRAIRQNDRFWQYLSGRGFPDVAKLISDYCLKCAVTGRFKDRVIIPLYQNEKLIGWTGRAIQKTILAPRYLSSGEEVKRTIFNEDRIEGDLLFITEGPFDAIKLDYFGQPLGVRATCIFGTSMSIEQASIIANLKFRRKAVLLDAGAAEQAWFILDWIPNAVLGSIPDGIKDPGEMAEDQIYDLIEAYI